MQTIFKAYIYNETGLVVSTGKSAKSGQTINPDKQSIILVEGIHALNPIFTGHLPHENIFKKFYRKKASSRNKNRDKHYWENLEDREEV